MKPLGEKKVGGQDTHLLKDYLQLQGYNAGFTLVRSGGSHSLDDQTAPSVTERTSIAQAVRQ